MLKKQSENNLKALDTLMAENKRLRQDVCLLFLLSRFIIRMCVSPLTLRKNERLINEITKKEPAVKKND